jgi:hypothetical protein
MSTKHTPFTSEPSKPHSSANKPETHVDFQHFGADGKQDKELTSQYTHITDPTSVEYAERTQQLREEMKDSTNTEDNDDSDDSGGSDDAGDSGDGGEGGE